MCGRSVRCFPRPSSVPTHVRVGQRAENAKPTWIVSIEDSRIGRLHRVPAWIQDDLVGSPTRDSACSLKRLTLTRSSTSPHFRGRRKRVPEQTLTSSVLSNLGAIGLGRAHNPLPPSFTESSLFTGFFRRDVPFFHSSTAPCAVQTATSSSFSYTRVRQQEDTKEPVRLRSPRKRDANRRWSFAPQSGDHASSVSQDGVLPNE